MKRIDQGEVDLREWDRDAALTRVKETQEVAGQHLQMQDELKAALAVAKQLAEDRAEAFRIMTESEFRCHQPSDDGGDDCANAENCFYHSMLALTEPKGAYQSLVKQRS